MPKNVTRNAYGNAGHTKLPEKKEKQEKNSFGGVGVGVGRGWGGEDQHPTRPCACYRESVPGMSALHHSVTVRRCLETH